MEKSKDTTGQYWQFCVMELLFIYKGEKILNYVYVYKYIRKLYELQAYIYEKAL